MHSFQDFRKYVTILKEDSQGSHKPGFILHLKVNGNRISFAPSYVDIESSITEVYTLMKNAVNDIRRLDHILLDGDPAAGKKKNLRFV